MNLTFGPTVTEKDLKGHVTDPDMYGACYYVAEVRISEGHTLVDLCPLPPDETRIAYDEWGQQKVTF